MMETKAQTQVEWAHIVMHQSLQKQLKKKHIMMYFYLLKHKSEGISYKEIVYAGLMIDNDTPSIVEFNVRFGDPETQVVYLVLKMI